MIIAVPRLRGRTEFGLSPSNGGRFRKTKAPFLFCFVIDESTLPQNWVKKIVVVLATAPIDSTGWLPRHRFGDFRLQQIASGFAKSS